eukprot:Tbor_TRINITY_DN9903_c0_g1::TRINITY_DN9903_c0_g1_i1::g.17682::m.17682
MNIREIISCIQSGSELNRVVACLSNFDTPLKERELQVLQAYHTALETNSPGDVQPIDPAILEKPTHVIPRSVVFSCIMSTIRLSTVRYDIKRALVMKVLPEVILCTFTERMAKRQAVLEWYALTYAATKNPDAAKKASQLQAHTAAVALVDVDALEKELGQVDSHEWNAALKMLISKGDWHFKGFLRCMEDILVILNQKASRVNNSNANFSEEVKKSFTDAVGKLLISICMRVVKCKKDTRGVGSDYLPRSSKATFTGISNIRRLVAAFKCKNGEESFALKVANDVISTQDPDRYRKDSAAFAILVQMIDTNKDDVKPINYEIFNNAITKS